MVSTVKAKPEAIARFKAAIERKRQIAAELEKEMTEEYEKQTGKKVKSFFVL
jgi:vacuolar-type H+-ATPase subunit H